ncbi:Phage-related integrase [Caballeronia sordidicola]|uniref:Phage-related integrase n=2 Tax=Caballeronia sordidicola TaxID=196367 RepID=A0A242MXK9_CABSO|nr:Phage-related integrase [Caballeronia sordidicola]
MPTSMQARVEQFLVERRQLGFSDDGYVLRSFARYVHAAGHRGALTVELMAAWARSDRREGNDPRTWAQRLKRLRTFLRWLRQFEARTEIPDDSIFGRLPQRQAPNIFSEEEIVDLLARSSRLGPSPALPPSTNRCLD